MEFWETDSSSGKAASQAYWNATKKLETAWRDVFDEALPREGTYAKETYENALAYIRERMRADREAAAALQAALDLPRGKSIGGLLSDDYADMDTLPPAAVKDALRRACHEFGSGEQPLREVLRVVMDELFDDISFRPRVGANRHWRRLLQYVRELEFDTDWSPHGRGIKIANAGGRGPVAREPRDPQTLKVVIDIDYL